MPTMQTIGPRERGRPFAVRGDQPNLWKSGPDRAVTAVIAFIIIRIVVWFMMQFEIIGAADADAVFFGALAMAFITIALIIPSHVDDNIKNMRLK